MLIAGGSCIDGRIWSFGGLFTFDVEELNTKPYWDSGSAIYR